MRALTICRISVAIVTFALASASITGCQSTGGLPSPGLGWLSWKKKDSPEGNLASKDPTITYPPPSAAAVPTTARPKNSSPLGSFSRNDRSYDSTPASYNRPTNEYTSGQPTSNYPSTSYPTEELKVPSSDGYRTGPYGTGPRGPTYTTDRTDSRAARPQQGTYSADTAGISGLRNDPTGYPPDDRSSSYSDRAGDQSYGDRRDPNGSDPTSFDRPPSPYTSGGSGPMPAADKYQPRSYPKSIRQSPDHTSTYGDTPDSNGSEFPTDADYSTVRPSRGYYHRDGAYGNSPTAGYSPSTAPPAAQPQNPSDRSETNTWDPSAPARGSQPWRPGSTSEFGGSSTRP